MTKKNKIYRYILLLLLFSGCNDIKTYDHATLISYSDFGEPILLNGNEVIFDEAPMKPVRLFSVDSFLFMINLNTEKHLHIYNINKREKVNEQFSFGSGPLELLHPQNIQFMDSFLWLFDAGKQNLLKYNTKDVLLKEPPQYLESIHLEEPFGSIGLLNNNMVVASILSFKHKRLSFYDTRGDLIKTVNEYPPMGEYLTPVEQIENFVGDFCVNRETNQILFAYKRTDLLEFYSQDGTLIKRLHGPDQFITNRKEKTDGEYVAVRGVSGEEKDAYFSPKQYRSEIFVLYSGKTYDPKEEYQYLHSRILVLDWLGNPVRHYKLDKPIFDFTIDEENRRFYGISDNPEFHILEFGF